MERVKVYTDKQPHRQGFGIYAQEMMRNNPLLPVEEEGRLGDPGLREDFIQRVYVLYRWQQENPALYAQFLANYKLRDDPRIGIGFLLGLGITRFAGLASAAFSMFWRLSS